MKMKRTQTQQMIPENGENISRQELAATCVAGFASRAAAAVALRSDGCSSRSRRAHPYTQWGRWKGRDKETKPNASQSLGSGQWCSFGRGCMSSRTWWTSRGNYLIPDRLICRCPSRHLIWRRRWTGGDNWPACVSFVSYSVTV